MVAHVNHSSSRMDHSYESNGLTFGRGAVRAPMPWRYLGWLVFVAIHQRGNWQEVGTATLNRDRGRQAGSLLRVIGPRAPVPRARYGRLSGTAEGSP